MDGIVKVGDDFGFGRAVRKVPQCRKFFRTSDGIFDILCPPWKVLNTYWSFPGKMFQGRTFARMKWAGFAVEDMSGK